jgi:hypothetical protein
LISNLLIEKREGHYKVSIIESILKNIQRKGIQMGFDLLL